MGGAVTHHKNTTSVDRTSPVDSPTPLTPVKEKPESSHKQRRKTFSSLGIKSSFDFRGQSFDIGSARMVTGQTEDNVSEKDKPDDLTEREKQLLTDTWKELEGNIAKVGVITFVSLFETHPDVQQSFMSFKGVDIEDLKHSKQLRAHALRVMAFVQKAIARLNEPEKLHTLICDLGRKHVTYGAKQKYVKLVGPQFILAIRPSLAEQWNDELHAAWTHLFDIIEFTMTTTMVDEKRRGSSGTGKDV